jgi:hypothetical protein
VLKNRVTLAGCTQTKNLEDKWRKGELDSRLGLAAAGRLNTDALLVLSLSCLLF